MPQALQFNGSTFARASTLGNLLSSKLTIESTYFRWGGGAGTMFSQCVSQSTSKEFQLFENGGNLWLSAGGQSNEFGSVSSIFGGSIFQGKLKVEVDFSLSSMVIWLDDVEVFNQSITVGATRIDGVNFRIGARGDQATSVSNGGGFYAPSGTEIGDTLVSINDTPVRNYVSDGVGSTWEESISSNDASVVGTASWVEYGTGADSLTILSPSVEKVFDWNNNTSAAVDFSVSFSGSPTSIERSIDGGQTWQVATSSPTSPYNESLSLAAGMYDVRYRFGNDNSITDSVSVGVGPVIVLIGHSNIMQLGDNNQVLQPSVNGVNAYMYGLDGNWKVAQDPLHSNANIQYSVGSDPSAGGTSWILFANQWLVDNPSIPIAFIPCAKGGTQATDWTYSTSTSTLYGAMRARVSAAANNNVDAFMCGFGGNEARFAVSYSQLTATLESIANSLQADYSAPMYFMPLQNYTTANRPVGDGRTNGKVAMSSAVMDFVASRSNCFIWASVFATDLDVGPNADGVHFKTDSQLTDLFNASYSSYVRGDTQCSISVPDAVDGIYTLSLSGSGYSVEYPVYVESGVANTSGFELDINIPISGEVSNGTDVYPLNGFVGGTLSEVQPPVANAGQDQSVAAGATVQLDGAGSSIGGTYEWVQVSGPTVKLVNADSAKARIITPQVTQDEQVVMGLTVTVDGIASVQSTVTINIASWKGGFVSSTATVARG